MFGRKIEIDRYFLRGWKSVWEAPGHFPEKKSLWGMVSTLLGGIAPKGLLYKRTLISLFVRCLSVWSGLSVRAKADSTEADMVA